MVRVNWQGKPRDYALIVALVALEALCAAAIGSKPNAQLAYIDPGVGAMIVQALAAAFFGAIFYFKNLRKALARFFLKLAGRAEAPAPEQVPAEVSSSSEKK